MNTHIYAFLCNDVGISLGQIMSVIQISWSQIVLSVAVPIILSQQNIEVSFLHTSIPNIYNKGLLKFN